MMFGDLGPADPSLLPPVQLLGHTRMHVHTYTQHSFQNSPNEGSN